MIQVHTGYVIIIIIILILFRMPPPIEVIKYIKGIQYNDIQYQDTKSVLCGYYCLYFLRDLIMVIQFMIYCTKTLKSPMKGESMIKHF